ncbi:MAG: radical SAM protein [Bacteroidales bacterium]|nr:radical SAM protein [Bacteroidales bacterium]
MQKHDNICPRCPRHCHADRVSTLGFCHSGITPEVASICIHGGEEPPISGTKGACNVFFAHCNLQCIYCQNLDISRATVDKGKIFYHSLNEVVARIEQLLPESENILGLVSPTHYIDSIPTIVERLHADGFTPTVVYNSNGYDDVEALRTIEPYIDIYLPDFKYMDSRLAKAYSNAADYPERAAAALREMCRQKGKSLLCDEHGMAFRGIIIRHLVLPGEVDNSRRVLDWIADNLSLGIHISLMAQYFPPEGATLPPALQRTITADEYQQVVEHYEVLGFYRGWVQELSANESYRPDFTQQDSFQQQDNG